jgi:hypothetical protein
MAEAMIGSGMRIWTFAAMVLPFTGIALATSPVPASAGVDSTCLLAAEKAANETGVPLDVLAALTLTETGRAQGGSLKPWPWALNEAGKSLWFESRNETLAHLVAATEGGTTNIDVGCFQLNYRWHGDAFRSLEEMLDPEANALYAARLIKRLYADAGSWVDAAGAYHSAMPDLADRYLARFVPIYEGLSDSRTEEISLADTSHAKNRFPLLKAGPAASGGSIVPLFQSSGPLFGEH